MRKKYHSPIIAWFLFVVGSTMTLTVQFVGRFSVAEMLIIGVTPIIVLRNMYINPKVLRVIFFAVAWLGAQVLSDIYNLTSFDNGMRGSMRVVVLICSLVCFSNFFRANSKSNPQKLVYFLFGLLLSQLYFGSQALGLDLWKFVYGPLIANMLIFISVWKEYRWGRPSLTETNVGIISYCVVLVSTNIRSLASVLMISVFSSFSPIVIRDVPRGSRKLSALALIGIGGLILFGIATTSTELAKTGIFGEEARAKVEKQADTGNIVLGARSESLVAIEAIKDAPLLGHGSWAETGKYDALIQELRDIGYNFDVDLVGIPSHSHILGGWVESGLVGAAFWIYVLGLSCNALLRLGQERVDFDFFHRFVAVTVIWDVVFSPFGGERRLLDGFYIVILLSPWDKYYTVKSFSRN